MELPRRSCIGVALRARTAALALGACGGDDSTSGGEAATVSPVDWQTRANGFCSDGTQEALALPLPTLSSEVGDDAGARAEIVITVRDGILPLARPEGQEEQIQAYLDELTDDARLLVEIRDMAAQGGDPTSLVAQVDESAGQAALALELEDCAAFSNAIARTP